MAKLKPSKAYLRFEGVIERSLKMVTLKDTVSKIWKVTAEELDVDLNDLNRASVVLAVAAMDAYFTDVFLERLVAFIKKKGPTKDLVKLLADAGLDSECALQLIVMKSPFRKIRSLVDDYLEKMTTQKFDVIDKLFAVYGLKDFSQNVSRYSRKGPRLLASVKKLVARRHQIAHEGDVSAFGQPREIDGAQIRKRIQAVVLFVSKSDELLAKQLK